jgi:hypothetical protein
MFKNIVARKDGSFVIEGEHGPYHVPNEGEFAELWENVNAYALAHPNEVTEETTPKPPSLEEARAAALEALRLRKWQAKDAGIAINGIAIDTDDKGQATINGAVTNCLIDPDFTAQWKTAATNPDGTAVWVTISKAEIFVLAGALTAHTEACFAVEAAKQVEIAALASAEDIENWLATALDLGWPQ